MDELTERLERLKDKCDHWAKNESGASKLMVEQALLEINAEAEAIHKKFPDTEPPPKLTCTRIIN